MIEYSTNNVTYKPEFWTFPSGEVGVKIAFDACAKDRTRVIISAALTNSHDIMQLLMLTDAIKRQYIRAEIHLLLGYTPYGRQDRVCNEGESLSVRVFADLINSQGYKTVAVIDPHSSVTTAVIDRCQVMSQEHLFTTAILCKIPGSYRDVIIAPDAGAMSKATDIFKSTDFKEVMFANKVRNLDTGEIIEYEFSGNVKDKHVVVVDDICDGGATFIELGMRLRLAGVASMTLYVTHGIFTKGHDKLAQLYDRVITTNTYHMDRTTTIDNVEYVEVI